MQRIPPEDGAAHSLRPVQPIVYVHCQNHQNRKDREQYRVENDPDPEPDSDLDLEKRKIQPAGLADVT